ncbi:MAG: PIN domain-containing protein [Candidatus Paceibacterota bacterium]|jgi:predicted nucleic acid-binding protein
MARKGQTEDKSELWYYDACALDEDKGIYGDVLGKKPIIAVVSHLALGEAYGNSSHKSEEAGNAFLELINHLKSYKILKIIGNDGTGKIMEEIKTEVDRISETDLMHISTAIKHKCQRFVTSDSDFCGWSSGKKRKIREIAKDNSNIKDFTILEK